MVVGGGTWPVPLRLTYITGTIICNEKRVIMYGKLYLFDDDIQTGFCFMIVISRKTMMIS